MDRGGSTEETRRRTKARIESCLVTKGRPGADRLSALSDELLLHILCFLPIRQAISTSSLSRRWRYLYHHLPSLDFSSRSGYNPSAWFIDRVLLLHAAPRVEVFRISMPHRDNANPLTALWQFYSRVMFAVRRNVRVLDLDFRDLFNPYESNYYDDRYNLPPSIFHCRTLEVFSLQHCDLRLPAYIRLASLKKMCLSYINFTDDELKRLLLGCPLLQSLELARCNQLRDLVIDAWESRNLEEFIIIDDGQSAFDIRAPSVKYLTFKGAAYRVRYHVRDLSSLVVASFQLNEDNVLDEDEAYVFTTDLLLRIHRVQVLKLCSWSLRVLSTRELQRNLDSAFPCVTRLELTTGLEEPELRAIPSALRACSKLRTLVLDIQRHKRQMVNHYSESDEPDEPDVPDETQGPRSLALDSTIMMQDLKTIMIQGLTRYDQDPEEEGSETEELIDIVLIGFLLEVSPALEKLVVQPAKYMNTMAEKWELLFKLSSDLLSLPRASPKARVIIEGK